jgi:uncharacterized protein YdeI (YjbR/CyaY-like superfamily)
MGRYDKRIDAYIAKSADFAKPILTHLRDVVHEACPEVEETLKWSHPHFMYKGMLCGMQAFKAHCALGFWKGSLIMGKAEVRNADGAGQFGRITSLKELPSKKVLVGYVKQAVRLNEEGVSVPKPAKKAAKPKPVVVPDELAVALGKNKKAQAAFDALSPSHRREYTEWIAEAKREETKTRRVIQAIEWISEGKSRNWKYQNC